MNRMAWWIFAFSLCFGNAVQAREIAGQWQGVLTVGGTEGPFRNVLRIARAEDGALKATLSSIDQSPREIPVTSISFDGSTLRFTSDVFRARYEGILSDDGTSLTGRWYGPRTPGASLPLDYHLATGAEKWPQDSSPHTIRFVTVDHGVKLEVLDWGGTGRPLVLLAGLGDEAHVFDKFAPKLTPAYHVYGFTRRGFGASSAPEPTNTNYSADRLGDDVLEGIDQLKLDRPVLAGHSIAGEELSSIGSRSPQRVSGLIYLDAAYQYAFYDQAVGDMLIDSILTRTKLARLATLLNLRDKKSLVDELLKSDLPQLVKDLEHEQTELKAIPEATLAEPAPPDMPDMKFVRAVYGGQQKYTELRCPVLAIFAAAPAPAPDSKSELSAQADAARLWQTRQIKAFESGVPTARVVVLQNADHYVFKSNEADVLQEINDFLAKLP